MAGFLRKIVGSLTGGAKEPRHGVFVAAFGKHPGERDHFEYMPADSRRLLGVWTFLYENGLKALVPAWRQWLPAERLDAFDHVILWRTSERIVAGRMWSSSDGASPPRKDFPIVVCAECRGLSMGWTVSEILPYLEKMGARFRETDSIKVVHSVVDSAREELARRAQAQQAADAEPSSPRDSLARLAHHPEMGPDGEGLWRVLYFLSGDLPVVKGGQGSPQRPLQMRVPFCAPTAGEACQLWTDVVSNFTDSKTSILCVAAVGMGWVDVLIGQPEPAQLSCIRSTITRVPLTTSIPYEIDDELVARFKALVGPGAAPRPAPVSPQRPAAAATSQPASSITPPARPAPAVAPAAATPTPPPAAPKPAATPTPAPAAAPAPAPRDTSPPAAADASSPPEAPIQLTLALTQDEPTEPEPTPEPAASLSEPAPQPPEPTEPPPPQAKSGIGKHAALLIFFGVGFVCLFLALLYRLGLEARREQARQAAENPSLISSTTQPSTIEKVEEKTTPNVVPEVTPAPTTTLAGNPDDPRTRWPGQETLTATRAALKALASEFDPRAARPLADTLEILDERLARLRNRPWSSENQPLIQRELVTLSADVTRLHDQAAAALRNRREFAGWIKQVRSRDTITTTAQLNAEWIRRRDTLLRAATPESQPRQALAAWETLLVNLDRSVRLDPIPAAPAQAWQPAFAAALAARRAGLLADLLKSTTGDLPAIAPDAVAAGVKSLQAYAADATLFLADHHQIAQLLEQGLLLDDAPGPGEKTIRQRYTPWTGKIPALGELDQPLERLRQSVALLIQVEGLQDPAKLATHLTGADAHRALKLTAWRRLHTLAPAVALKQWKDWEAPALAALADLPKARAAALAAEIKSATRSRWLHAINSAASDDSIDSALADAVAFEADPATLDDPRIRFNLLLRALRKDFAAAADDNAAHRIAAAFLDSARPLKLASPADLGALDKAIRASTELSQTAAPGPGAENGWQKQPTESGLRFTITTRDGRPQVLEFIRVEPRDGATRPFYLMTTEVSLGVFVHAVNARGNWPTVATLLGTQDELRPRGPWGWSPRSDGRQVIGLERSLQWVNTRRSFIDGGRPETAYEAPDLRNTVEAPGYDHPMQQVPIPAALYIAHLLHCRLPTSAEWLAAAAAAPQPHPAKPNLRDRTWSRQHAHISERIKTESVTYPDSGIFGPRDQFRTDAAAQVWAASLKSPQSNPTDDLHDDGTLWFRSVNLPADHPCRNLVGNVAEFICDDPTLPRKLAAAPWNRLDETLRGIEFAVIGGSALSPPELPLDKPIPLRPRDVDAKFCDVGFRLAFDAPAAPARATLRQHVEAIPYLPPAPPKTAPSPDGQPAS